MCCFTRPVESVSATKIYARDADGNRQFLVYSMNYRASDDLAMVLPLPVPVSSREDAVRFIDLHDYSDFFTDLHAGFPEPQSHIRSRGPIAASASIDRLAVVQVGSFEASFVPQRRDFARLDARFRMPDGVWDKLPAYQQSGFAVFKLRSGVSSVHPMALAFPRADAKKIFFPTVHIHDGQVHDTAYFDHQLYCQVGNQHRRTAGWAESPQLADAFMRVAASRGIIDGHAHCYLKTIRGSQKNQDTLL